MANSTSPSLISSSSIAAKGGVQGQPIIVNVPGPSPEDKDGLADILNASAAVLWPLVVALALILFRSQIVFLTKRMRKGSLLGAEAEFVQEELQDLNREVVRASEEVAEAPGPDADYLPVQEPETESDRIRSRALDETARSPRLGLMFISSQIDRLVRKIAAHSGFNPRHSTSQQIESWASSLPPSSLTAYRLFSQIRNRIVHGRLASDEEVLSAIDSGITLYTALASMPIPTNTVIEAGIPLFSDEDGNRKAVGSGVMIETKSGSNTHVQIVPTRKLDYRPGMLVTIDYDMGNVWGPAWRRDDTTGQIIKLWIQAVEFVGTNAELLD